jgi:hypothetical protein
MTPVLACIEDSGAASAAKAAQNALGRSKRLGCANSEIRFDGRLDGGKGEEHPPNDMRSVYQSAIAANVKTCQPFSLIQRRNKVAIDFILGVSRCRFADGKRDATTVALGSKDSISRGIKLGR